jgi:hypothetical protein
MPYNVAAGQSHTNRGVWVNIHHAEDSGKTFATHFTEFSTMVH